MSTQWANHLKDEIEFWRGVIRDVAEAGPTHPNYAPHEFSAAMAESYIGERKLGETIRILDVGSGPFSTMGIPGSGETIEITQTDALGDIYNMLLAEAGLTLWPKVENVEGEILVERFGKDAFDLVNCANALDHFNDPAEAFSQMIKVCGPRGVLHIVSVENEGMREAYDGLHQWNISADSDGLYLTDKNGNKTNLIEDRNDIATYEWEYLDHGQVDFNIIGVRIVKRGTE